MNEYKKKYKFNWDEMRDYWDVPQSKFDKITGEPLMKKEEVLNE